MPTERTAGTVLIAHHTPDLYGSDLQLLESVTGLVDSGRRVIVSLPHSGPLAPLLEARGAEITFLDVPVLRKSLLSLRGLVKLLWHSFRSLRPAVGSLKRSGADAVYVNTLTIPLWILAGRLARVPVLCHVHEAQNEGNKMVRAGLAAPLLFTQAIVVNSRASQDALTTALPLLSRKRTTVVYNGINGPVVSPRGPERNHNDPAHLVLVGRLSPRKGSDVALEAVEKLLEQGYDVRMTLAGTAFEGYEWFADELRAKAGRPPLAGCVEFLGYVNPVWELLDSADVVLVPSRTEPFGNTAVEAQLSRRPVVASRVQGLREIIEDAKTGFLAEPGNSTDLAAVVARVLDNPGLARRVAEEGFRRAGQRFSTHRYAEMIVAEVHKITNGRGAPARRRR